MDEHVMQRARILGHRRQRQAIEIILIHSD
jgi:hypothetical protein